MRLKYKRLAGYRTGEMHETARPGYEKTGLFEDGGGVCNRHTSSVDYVTQSGIFFCSNLDERETIFELVDEPLHDQGAYRLVVL